MCHGRQSPFIKVLQWSLFWFCYKKYKYKVGDFSEHLGTKIVTYIVIPWNFMEKNLVLKQISANQCWPKCAFCRAQTEIAHPRTYMQWLWQGYCLILMRCSSDPAPPPLSLSYCRWNCGVGKMGFLNSHSTYSCWGTAKLSSLQQLSTWVSSGSCRTDFTRCCHYLRLGTKKGLVPFLRALHVYSIDNFVAFWLKWL